MFEWTTLPGSVPPRDARWVPGRPFPRLYKGTHRLDEEDYNLIEHVRMFGRLPGSGVLDMWGVSDFREPVIEPEDIVWGCSQRAEKHSRAADRKYAAYLTPLGIAQTEAIAARAREGEEKRKAAFEAAKQKRIADTKLAAATMKQEYERRAAEKRRKQAEIAERSKRWIAEQKEWNETEGKGKPKGNGQKYKRRRWHIRQYTKAQHNLVRMGYDVFARNYIMSNYEHLMGSMIAGTFAPAASTLAGRVHRNGNDLPPAPRP